MFTREEAIKRLEDIEKEIRTLKQGLQEEWAVDSVPNATQRFLEKCGGWEDTRTVEEIIVGIYRSRTISDRGADFFPGQGQ